MADGPTHGLRAVVFDTDGVLTDSASLHAAAWREAFDPVLTAAGQPPFDADGEYRRWVDGRSRPDGAAALLTARDLRLPDGAPDDPPGVGSVRAVAAAKEAAFTRLLRERGAPAWPDAVRLLRALDAAGVPRAAVSASRHAGELLAAAGLRELFDVLLDGGEAARLGLPGKPDPALFLAAAARLGVPAGECALVEDAVAGVAAGRRGGFGLVVGVDRTPDGVTELAEHGADVVVRDLTDLWPATSEARR
ncbi:HAD-IA family hydrolase [Streptomyces sp. OF3]|uniref:HAD-IA family hydrolase n=1 Tax=Streptomyces alkaliterrae TaxID=2213162 RepID=A0A7W3WNU0_9ACTN|nr:HAD-IA family hydrolase [Streptomyces alkaliterrae]MBB1255797.1 HAD-IA family hydrolase [Streptomyces alkaliterrae]